MEKETKEEKTEEKDDNMEQWDNKKEKKSSAALIIIILLIIIVLLLGGFIYLKKDTLFTSHNNETKESNEDIEKEEITFLNSELENYVNYVNPITYDVSELVYDISSVKASELSMQEKITYVGGNIHTYNYHSEDFRTISEITEKDLKETIDEIYGPGTYKRQDFKLGCGNYKFNESEGTYKAELACGGSSSFLVKNEVIGYHATKEKLEITTAYVFFNEINNKICKDFNGQEPLEDHTLERSDKTLKYLTQYIKDHKDELYHIVYTFESENGKDYYFKELKHV